MNTLNRQQEQFQGFSRKLEYLEKSVSLAKEYWWAFNNKKTFLKGIGEEGFRFGHIVYWSLFHGMIISLQNFYNCLDGLWEAFQSYDFINISDENSLKEFRSLYENKKLVKMRSNLKTIRDKRSAHWDINMDLQFMQKNGFDKQTVDVLIEAANVFLKRLREYSTFVTEIRKNVGEK